MKTENRDILGFNVPVVGIAETLAEAVQLAGSEDSVLKDYNNNVLYHSHFTLVRREIVKKLVELTGVKQLTEKDGEKEVVAEKDAAYIARLEEELGEEGLKTYNDAVAKHIGQFVVDYTPGTRGAGIGATPAKKWLAYYDQMVTEDKLVAFCNKYGIDQTLDEESLKVAVAQKVKQIVTEKMAAVTRSLID